MTTPSETPKAAPHVTATIRNSFAVATGNDNSVDARRTIIINIFLTGRVPREFRRVLPDAIAAAEASHSTLASENGVSYAQKPKKTTVRSLKS